MTLFSRAGQSNGRFLWAPVLTRRAADLKLYALAVVACIVILSVSLKLWGMDFNRPVDYWGDAIMVQVWSKTIYEFGWYIENPRLGAPMTMNMGDFPMADGLHQIIYKGLSWITPNFVVALNLFYLATFPLTALTALYVSRRLGLSSWTALTCSLLYAFLPYHFLRQVHHLYLASYYVVPLSILVIVRVYTGEAQMFEKGDGENAAPRKPGMWGSLLICILQGCAGVYYGFFACYLLLVSGGMSAVRKRSISPLFTAVFFIAVTTGSLLVNLSPHLLYRIKHGHNPAIASRKTVEPEVHGLKITQMILPSIHHRVDKFAEWARTYNANSVSTHENSMSTLGLVGVVGFFLLVFGLWIPSERANSTIRLFSVLTIFSVFLCTIGGWSSLFSFFVTPLIRGYNRISVFIAFFSIFATCLLLERLNQSLTERGYRPWLFQSLICAVLGIGLLDQIPAKANRLYVKNPLMKARWENDVDFFGRIEASMPERALIFQYPHLTFPECQWPAGVPGLPEGGGFRYTCYEHGRGYLHTKTLRWSYPIRGRFVDTACEAMKHKPMSEQLRRLALGDFSGIYIFRPAYADRGTELEAKLTELLGGPPIVSQDKTMSFYDIRNYADLLKQSVSPEEWEAEKKLIWNSPRFNWGKGFYRLELVNSIEWRQCESECELVIDNPFDTEEELQFEFICMTHHPEPATLSIESELLSAEIAVNNQGVKFTRTLTIPPGEHHVKFTCDAVPYKAPGDPRNLVFQIRHFKRLLPPANVSHAK